MITVLKEARIHEALESEGHRMGLLGRLFQKTWSSQIKRLRALASRFAVETNPIPIVVQRFSSGPTVTKEIENRTRFKSMWNGKI